VDLPPSRKKVPIAFIDGHGDIHVAHDAINWVRLSD
jgi:FixJ family two-component response regulator